MKGGEAVSQKVGREHRACVHGADSKERLNRRPRLLFLAYFFPPAAESGCVRSWNIAKYLTRLGWDVTVVTPHESVWRHAENAESIRADLEREGIRYIVTSHRLRCLSPNRLNCWNRGIAWFIGGACRKTARWLGISQEIGWIKAAQQACSGLTAKDVDVILATGGPFIVFRLAKRLSDRLGRPYVLDYRDPWTQNPHANRSADKATIREEARLLTGAAAATIVSGSWASALNSRFCLGRKLHILSNGYDPGEFETVKPYDFGHRAIVYAGSFYPPKRVISPVLAALKRLKGQTSNGSEGWFFHYFGEAGNHVLSEAERIGVVDRVVLHGKVSRAEVQSAVRGASVTVVITTVSEEGTEEDRGIVTGKIFEALGLGAPILLIAPPGSDAEDVLQVAGMGVRVSGKDVHGITRFLVNSTRIMRRLGSDHEQYAWPGLAKKLDTILREVIVRSNKTAVHESLSMTDHRTTTRSLPT